MRKPHTTRINKKNIIAILEEYRNYLYNERGIKFSNINTYIKEIKGLINYLNIEIEKLPQAKDENQKQQVKYLDNKELKELFKSIPTTHTRDIAIYKTFYKTGLRRAELAGLNKEDLNLKSKKETIAIKLKHGKGNKARAVFIDQDCLKAINKMIAKRKDHIKKNRKKL